MSSDLYIDTSTHEYEQHMKLYQRGALVCIIAPAHTGLPRNASGMIIKVHEGKHLYDIMITPANT